VRLLRQYTSPVHGGIDPNEETIMQNGTTRMNVTLPTELAERVERELPRLNRSRVFQDALRAQLGCEHDALECAACGSSVERRSIALDAVERFFLDAWALLGEATHEGQGTEFVARRLREIATAHGLERIAEQPLPRRARGQRAGS